MVRQAIPLDPVEAESLLHTNTSCSHPSPTSAAGGLLSRIRRWYRFSSLRLLVSEIRSLAPRSKWILQIREAKLHRGDQAINLWMKGAVVRGSERYKRAHICYMRQTRTEYPFLSVFDRLLLTKAWKAGSEWNARMGMSRNESQGHSCDQLSQVPNAGTNTVPDNQQLSRKSQSCILLPKYLLCLLRLTCIIAAS
jgi:hypothetical protein